MRNIDQPLTTLLIGAGGQQSCVSHRTYDSLDRLGFTGTGDELGYRGAAPGVFCPLARRCQPQHDPPHNFLLLGAESGVDRVSTFGKCAMDTTSLAIGLQRHHPAASPLPKL